MDDPTYEYLSRDKTQTTLMLKEADGLPATQKEERLRKKTEVAKLAVLADGLRGAGVNSDDIQKIPILLSLFHDSGHSLHSRKRTVSSI